MSILVTLALVLVLRACFAVKRPLDHDNSSKGKYLIGAGVQSRGSVHYHQSGKHGGAQADVLLE